MTKPSLQALQLLAELLEEAEATITVCDDVAPLGDRELAIAELWELYSNQLDQLREQV